MNILADFANRVPELYLKASIDEKRMILTTITESIVINEEAQTIRVKLKPVFEHLWQLKLQNKGYFTAEIKNLDGTLKSRSDRAKQALNNEHSDVNELEDYGTRKKLLNTKIEPNLYGSIENNVVRGTWTPKDCSTRPSNVRVYRFRHYDKFFIKISVCSGIGIFFIRFVSLSFELTFLHSKPDIESAFSGVLATTTSFLLKFQFVAASVYSLYGSSHFRSNSPSSIQNLTLSQLFLESLPLRQVFY